MPKISQWMGNEPAVLHRYLQEGSDTHICMRRGMAALGETRQRPFG